MGAPAEKKEPRQLAVILYDVMEQLRLSTHSVFDLMELLEELKETMPKAKQPAESTAEVK